MKDDEAPRFHVGNRELRYLALDQRPRRGSSYAIVEDPESRYGQRVVYSKYDNAWVLHGHGSKPTLFKTTKNAIREASANGGTPVILELDLSCLPIAVAPESLGAAHTHIEYVKRVLNRVRRDPVIGFRTAEHEMQAWGLLADRLLATGKLEDGT